MFQMDPELADSHYMKYYADTNNTMYLCTPRIPVKPDLRKKYAETHPDRYSMARCHIYQLGYLKLLYKVYHRSFIFSADYPLSWRIYHIVIIIISITAIFVEFHLSH